MSKLNKSLAVFAARTITWTLRTMGRGATTLPGRVALRICPDLMTQLSAGNKVMLITGTNGKTTTTHMVSGIMKSAGYQVVTNVSGANLATGITATLIEGLAIQKKAAKTGGRVIYIIEIDEAAFAKISGQLDPVLCVVTNLFRDQLDRYGELVHTQSLIAKGLDATKGLILLNADDSLVAALGKGRENRSHFFGFNELSMIGNSVTKADNKGSEQTTSDAAYCSFCQTKYQYKGRVFGHLGDFYCPSCGYQRPKPEFIVSYDLQVTGTNNKSPADVGFPIQLSWQAQDITVGLPIPGLHNFYNSLAAVAACTLAGQVLKDNKLNFAFAAKAMEEIKAAFGRMEKIPIGNKSLCLLLVKNPVGLESALSFVSQASDAGAMYLLLNSNIADGKDISWIWDVDFESRAFPEHIFVSGERYGDMYLRLAYAGIDKERMVARSIEECGALVDEALSACEEGQCLYILPNYTSMLALRKILVTKYNLKDFWK